MDCVCFIITFFSESFNSFLSHCVMLEVKMASLITIDDDPLSENASGPSSSEHPYPDITQINATDATELESFSERPSEIFTDNRVLAWTQIDAFEGIDPQEINQTQWQDYDIPQELELIQAGTPQEICRIIKASLDRHRASNASSFSFETVEDRDDGNGIEAVNIRLDTVNAGDNTTQPKSTSPSITLSASVGSSTQTSERSTPRASVSSTSSVGSGPGYTPNGLPPTRTPGLPKVTMGPLGWIMTYEDGEKPKSWWRRHKESKRPRETQYLVKPTLRERNNG